MEALVFGFILLLPLYLQVRRMRVKQDETASRLTSQMHAVYLALQEQRRELGKVLTEIQAPPAAESPAAETPAPVAKTPPLPESPPAVSADVTPATQHDERPIEQSTERTAEPAEDHSGDLELIPAAAASSQKPQPDAHTVGMLESLQQRRAERARQLGSVDQHAKPRPAPAPNRFEAAAKDVLRRIWNWIIVGEEHLPQGVSVEFAIASQWLLRIGIVLLVVGMGFFLKYSIDNGLLSPTARVFLAIASGLVMLTAGIRILGGKFHVMGQGLLGGGIATLYFSAFSAANLYHLIDMVPAFAAMICVTALSGFIAVRFHSILTAVLGVIGGYATPVLLSTGQTNFPGLYGYLLVLGLGVLGVCAWKRWPLLNYLSLAGTWILVTGSLSGYRPNEHFLQVMPFLAAFFVLFSTMVFIYNLRNKTKSNLLDVLVLYLNAAVFFSLSYWVIDRTFSEKWVAAVTLSLTAFYAAHVWYCLVRRVLDRELMLSFTALSAFFLAITVPLLLSREWITVSWSIQACVMLWVAGKLGSEFLRTVAYVLYVIVLGRFLFLDLGHQYGRSLAADLPMFDYIKQLGQRLIMFGIPIGSMWLGYRMLTQQGQTASVAVDRAADVGRWIENRTAAKAGLYVICGMLFLYLHLELNRTFGSLYPPLRLPVLTMLWLTVCGLLTFEFARTGSRIVQGFAFAVAGAVILKLLFVDLQSWSASTQFLYEGDYRFFDAGFRLLDFGVIIAFFAIAARMLMKSATHEQPQAHEAGIAMGFLGVCMLFLFTTLELNSFLKHYVENLRSGGISILWSLFALAFLLQGIARNIRSLRLTGLALFLVITWKVFFVDLARLDQLYRIVAFIVLGLLVLCGSFLYLRSRQTFETADPNALNDPPEDAQPSSIGA
ncbi:MAG: DUF2339 domain-containing protein, partial [Planctomycetaceae bacterium]